jgi:flagellar basal-body rod modification protein FlgD
MTTVTSTAATKTEVPAAASKLNADFNMFLKLLTAQMQNQDPLDPMDTAQYTQQLVQYSQVEQSISQNTTLKSILASLSSQDLAQASTMIGRQVEVDSPTTGLSADMPAQWNWSATREVASLTATIRDASGRAVETRALDAGAAAGGFAWDGSLSGGGKAAAGSYTLELNALDAAGAALPVTVHSSGVMSDVRTGGGAVQITVGGVQVPLSLLQAVKA